MKNSLVSSFRARFLFLCLMISLMGACDTSAPEQLEHPTEEESSRPPLDLHELLHKSPRKRQPLPDDVRKNVIHWLDKARAIHATSSGETPSIDLDVARAYALMGDNSYLTQIVRGLDEEHYGAAAYAALAQSQANSGNFADARENLQAALEIANNNPVDDGEQSVLRVIADELADAGNLIGAAKIASRVVEESEYWDGWEDWFRNRIGFCIQRGELSTARDIATLAPIFFTRAKLLEKVARSQRKAVDSVGEKQTRTLLDQTIVQMVVEASEGSDAAYFSWIAVVQADAGFTADARESLLKAEKYIHDESKQVDAATARVWIAEGWRHQGDNQRALDNLKQVAKTVARARDEDRELYDDLVLYEVIYDLVGEFVELGQTDQAFLTVGGMTGGSKMVAIEKIATTQAQRGRINNALATARLLEDEDIQSMAYSEIVSAQTKSGATSAAVETVSLISDDFDRSYAILQIAERLVQDGKFQAATSIAARDSDPFFRSRTYRRIANIAATTSQFDDVDRWIKSLSSPDEQWNAYLGAALGLIEQ